MAFAPVMLAPFMMPPFTATPFAFTPAIVTITAVTAVTAIPHHNWRRRRHIHRRLRRVVARHADPHIHVDMRGSCRRCHQNAQPQYRTQYLLVHLVSPRTCRALVYATKCRSGVQIQVLPECDKSNRAYLEIKRLNLEPSRQTISPAIARRDITAFRIVTIQLPDVLSRTEVHIRIIDGFDRVAVAL